MAISGLMFRVQLRDSAGTVIGDFTADTLGGLVDAARAAWIGSTSYSVSLGECGREWAMTVVRYGVKLVAPVVLFRPSSHLSLSDVPYDDLIRELARRGSVNLPEPKGG